MAPEANQGPPVCYGRRKPDDDCSDCGYLEGCADGTPADQAAGQGQLMPQQEFLDMAAAVDAAVGGQHLQLVDPATGDVVQQSLLGAAWDAYQVKTTQLRLSGGDEFEQELLAQLVHGGDLEPGAIVEVQARGIVTEHAPIYKKDEHTGKTTIKLDVVRKITIMGYAKNSTGEPTPVMQAQADQKAQAALAAGQGHIAAAQAEADPTAEDDVIDEQMHGLLAEADAADPEPDPAPDDEPAVRDCSSCLHWTKDESEQPCCNCHAVRPMGGSDQWQPRGEADGC